MESKIVVAQWVSRRDARPPLQAPACWKKRNRKKKRTTTTTWRRRKEKKEKKEKKKKRRRSDETERGVGAR